VRGLVVADDLDEAALLSLVLQRANLEVTSERDLERTMRRWSENPSDLIVLAVPLPHPRDQVRMVRSHTEVPLTVVVHWPDEELQVALLDLGADLVVARPFSARWLMAQLRALLRRAAVAPTFNLPSLSLAGLTLDAETRTVEIKGRSPRKLTALEYRLLYNLMLHPGQVLPTPTIVDRVWGYRSDPEDRDLVRGLVSRLRAKVEADPHHPGYIRTVAGVGYAFGQPDEPASKDHE
jgi:DNA-binding response OmpR family regulator